MTCLEVRERLTEHALGVLPKVDATEVERHLEWCAGCRKESAELEEGAARMALALPVETPGPTLESRVVGRVLSAAGTIPSTGRRRSGRLVAVTLVAALLAVGAMGWAIAERGRVQTLQQTVSAKEAQLRNLARLDLVKGRGQTFTAKLVPALGGRGGGSAVISSAPGDDWVFIDVLLPSAEGPFIFQLVDNKSALSAVRLRKATEGDWVRYWRTDQDLSHVVSVTVLDNQSRTVLRGQVRPYGS